MTHFAKKKKVDLHWTCFVMKTRKVSLYPQTLILTMLFLAINFSKPLKPRSTKCFPSVSHLVLSTVLPPLLIQTKKCQMNTVWVHGESGVQWVYLSISLPQAGLLILNYNKNFCTNENVFSLVFSTAHTGVFSTSKCVRGNTQTRMTQWHMCLSSVTVENNIEISL